ncbi:Crp/Fnr family transcriptional regulator [Allosalinactinospora lopnorensis]|uniref:Crp/Fnr family transcriptional regulator n=1 Tax=Allosalinactinospora lopnorensis TaxID=1352348 RepID=UPI000623F0A0|nr:Crp/Fnr family transcriptional regulator [Allosalinactinospora lopnorensis]
MIKGFLTVPHRLPIPQPSWEWPPSTFVALLNDDTRRSLFSLASAREYPADTTLLHQGAGGDLIYILRSAHSEFSACVKVTARLSNGRESLLGIRVSGDIIGELALLRGRDRMATVTTCARTLVHALPGWEFLRFLDQHSDAWKAVGSIIGDRLEWADHRRLDFAGYDVPVRLARVVVDLADRHGIETPDGIDLGVRLSHVELGRIIGSKEDAVGQAVRKLRNSGYITSRYRNLVITNLESLRAFAEFA